MNCSRYRILTPAKYLSMAGHDINLISNPGISKMHGDRLFDLDFGIDYSKIKPTVLIERTILPDLVDKLRLAGAKKIVMTCDDNYSKFASLDSASAWWERNYTKFQKALGMVDLVIVPSKVLLNFYKPFAKKIAYVPNYLDDDLYKDLPTRGDAKIIGWGGSVQHAESWRNKKMLKALDRILKENPDWELHLTAGNIPGVIAGFPTGMTIKWRDWLSHTEWPKEVSTFTIGIAPLFGDYDRYRSNLKVLEYGICGVPWVASLMEPYSDTHVRGGVLTKDMDWYEALSLLVGNEKARDTLSSAGKEWAEGYKMSKNVSVYENALWEK
jgi:glycosyltransferase involved in cell wall biosynthesis